ncbi:NADP-dependent oxidoreductase [Actinomycetospora lutea]|uniref:NADP-dependent oxidoreductase n=1 Tax=Actinomycetospora lutea TaxID=663604 RepID=UPI002365C18D|nr:NADP-dependent oxidoreductase [Actinomycetospora lutea]MDD7939044.1 NADP-dependent oxidoreductase [Actinomycetospora lutea]
MADEMRVGCFASFGDASVMRIERRAAPAAPCGAELLVGVDASSINGTDLGLRRGDLPPLTWGRMPFVPGFDVAGRVLATGPAVTAFSVGDRVAALLPHRGGGLAEQVLLAQDRAARIPDAVAATDAAAVTLAGLTALQALHRHGRLRARQRPGGRPPRVLVSGAAGGIGSFGVQLAALAGGEVTGTTSAAKTGWVRDLGAHRVLDRRADDLAAQLRVAGPFELVLDAAGRSRHRELAPYLAPGGIVVSVRPLHPDVLRALRPGRADFAAVRTAARSADLAALLHLVATGRLRVPVEHVVGLGDVARAHELAESEGRGKVVVDLTA